ncbi:hypothetical protein F2Q69_00009897 [Brassica cretica]|uniref:Uncharacterized protein n=1 Tax=Brassica cretica TaxID=69181 RepID=A0A8S9P5I0_BRACR|nr:hypothetical protein F2Q69_00009897 [Brassica cretica]
MVKKGYRLHGNTGDQWSDLQAHSQHASDDQGVPDQLVSSSRIASVRSCSYCSLRFILLGGPVSTII